MSIRTVVNQMYGRVVISTSSVVNNFRKFLNSLSCVRNVQDSQWSSFLSKEVQQLSTTTYDISQEESHRTIRREITQNYRENLSEICDALKQLVDKEDTDGLFRVSSTVSMMKQLSTEIEKRSIDISAIDKYALANLLKLEIKNLLGEDLVLLDTEHSSEIFKNKIERIAPSDRKDMLVMVMNTLAYCFINAANDQISHFSKKTLITCTMPLFFKAHDPNLPLQKIFENIRTQEAVTRQLLASWSIVASLQSVNVHRGGFTPMPTILEEQSVNQTNVIQDRQLDQLIEDISKINATDGLFK